MFVRIILLYILYINYFSGANKGPSRGVLDFEKTCVMKPCTFYLKPQSLKPRYLACDIVKWTSRKIVQVVLNITQDATAAYITLF